MPLLSIPFYLESAPMIGFGMLIGLCLGLTGVGGGVLIIPILTAYFGMPTIMAVGTASLISSIVKVNAGIAHIRARNIEWRPLLWMLVGAIPMTLGSTTAVVYLSEHETLSSAINATVESLIVIIMLLALVSIILKYRASTMGVEKTTVGSHSTAIFSGMACGSILGSTGVGGGVMLLPAFNTIMGVSIKKSVGSSVVMALILSSITALNYSRGGQSDITVALIMSAGAFIGIPLAVRLLKHFNDTQLYLLTFIVVGVSLVLTLLK